MTVMENSSSGVQRTVLGGLHRLWSLLFGFIYYAFKGMWGWAIISFFTANGLFILMPLWNRTIVTQSYENSGWRIVED